MPAPERLRIPALDVDAPVVGVGVDDATSEMAVPPDATTAAWYRHGPSPGAPGSAVIAAHVDYNGAIGLFFHLEDLRSGDEVTVGYADGTSRSFVVTRRESFAKPQLPTEQLFRRDGQPVLTLITCGGSFDESARSYRDNIVVTAVPADAPA